MALVMASFASAVDFNELSRTRPDEICTNLLLRFSQQTHFFEGDPGIDGDALRAQLDALKARLAGAIEADSTELAKPEKERTQKDPRWFWQRRPNPVDVALKQRIAENQQRWDLVDGVAHLLARVDSLELEVNDHLMDTDLSAAFDDLIHLWITQRANELGVKVGLLVTETLHDGASVSEAHLARARTAMNSLNEAVGQVERLAQGARPTAEQNRLYSDFLRAAGRAKLREFISGLRAKGIPLPPVNLLKQLLPVSFVSGLNFEKVFALWGAATTAYEKELGDQLSEAAAVAIVRSAARHQLNAEQVAEFVGKAHSAARDFAGRTVEGREFAALFDLVSTPGWTLGSVVTRYRLTTAFLRSLREQPFDLVTVLALIQSQSPEPLATESWQKVMEEFALFVHLDEKAAPEARLSDAALAFLVAGSAAEGNLRGAYSYVGELISSGAWGPQNPGYSSEGWVILSQVGRRYGWSADDLAAVTRRLFELRGKKMEVGRVVTILSLVMEKKRRSALPDGPIENRELAEFMSMPYLRFTLPIEDLRLEGPDRQEVAAGTFWGSEPVKSEAPSAPNHYAIWNWDFNDGHPRHLELGSWYTDPNDGSFGLHIDGLRFDSDGDAVTWRP